MPVRAAAASVSARGCSKGSMSTRASSRRAAIRHIRSMYACLYLPPAPDRDAVERGETGIPANRASSAVVAVVVVAQSFSPRYECHSAALVAIDVSGLDRLIGPPRVIGEELRRACADRGLRAHVAVAPTWTAAVILAHARAGLTVVRPGEEADALAPIAVGIVDRI